MVRAFCLQAPFLVTCMMFISVMMRIKISKLNNIPYSFNLCEEAFLKIFQSTLCNKIVICCYSFNKREIT